MSFDFAINLSGTFAAQLQPVTAGLEKTDTALKKTTADVKLFEVATGKLHGSLGGLSADFSRLASGGPLFVFDLAEGARLAAAAIGTLISKTFEYGKSLAHVIAQKQDLDLAIRLNAGEKGVADLNDIGESFASNTRFDDDVIKQALLPLLEIGIKDRKVLADVATAATDLNTRSAGRIGVAEAVQAFQRAALKGEVDPKILRALNLGVSDYYAKLGAQLGISAAQAQAMNKAGKVATEQSIHTLLTLVADAQGGALGVASLEGGKTLGATLQRLEDLPANMFKKLSDSPGVARLQATIDGVIERLNGPDGDRIVGTIGKAIDTLTAPETVQWFQDFGKVLSWTADLVLDVARGFGIVGDAVGYFFAIEYLGFEKIITTIAGFPAQAWQFGVDLVEGFANGIRSAIGSASDAIGELADGAVNSLRSLLGIHSPSTVFAELGRNTGEGFAVGLEQSEDRVKVARQSLTSTGAVAGGSGGNGSGGGMVINAPINITVEGAQNPKRTAEAIDEQIVIGVTKIFKRIGYSHGVAA